MSDETPTLITCPLCKEIMEYGCMPDGCRVPECPMLEGDWEAQQAELNKRQSGLFERIARIGK